MTSERSNSHNGSGAQGRTFSFMTILSKCQCFLTTLDHEEEFVVPHMNISCLVNSLTFMDVMRQPALLLNNFQNLSTSSQKAVFEHTNEELRELESRRCVGAPFPTHSQYPSAPPDTGSNSSEVENQ